MKTPSTGWIRQKSTGPVLAIVANRRRQSRSTGIVDRKRLRGQPHDRHLGRRIDVKPLAVDADGAEGAARQAARIPFVAVAAVLEEMRKSPAFQASRSPFSSVSSTQRSETTRPPGPMPPSRITSPTRARSRAVIDTPPAARAVPASVDGHRAGGNARQCLSTAGRS